VISQQLVITAPIGGGAPVFADGPDYAA